MKTVGASVYGVAGRSKKLHIMQMNETSRFAVVSTMGKQNGVHGHIVLTLEALEEHIIQCSDVVAQLREREHSPCRYEWEQCPSGCHPMCEHDPNCP